MTTLVNRVIFKSNKNNGLGTSIDIQGNIDISGNIIPSSNSFDLGSNTQQWRDMHFSGNLYQNGLSYTGSQWTTSGNKLFYTAGNIGIGTNNPINTLDVSGNSRISGNIAVGGNLSVSGTLTTIDSTTVTVQDPIITLGQSVLTSNDNKDRGIEFLYYDGSSKRGFFGFDNTNSNLIYLINATNSSEVLTGTYGNIQGGAFISSNTSGAPLTVTSSGLVTNLNADLLDGQDGTYYRNMNNVTNGTLKVEYGGTGTNSLTSGKLLVGAGTSAVLTPVDLTWNGSNLGIGSSNPIQKLDVSGNIAASGNISAGNYISCANINFTGILYQNSSPYIGSQWTTSGNTIFYNTGNVGIGSSNPSQKLDVSGNIAASGNISAGNYVSCANINFTGDLYKNSSLYLGSQWTTSGSKIYYNGGNVGIGTINPGNTLDVSGNIYTSNTITGTRLISNIGSGTAPITVTSSTLVTNLNADLLDNQDSTYYLNYDNLTNKPTISSSQWTTSGTKIYYNTGNVGIGTVNPGNTLDVSGNIYASGDISAFSDKRYKTNIEKITNAIDKINAINGYTFNRVGNMDKRMMGVIAQELELVIPEVVYQQGDTLSVAYGNIVAVCIEAIKELDEKIKELEKLIKK